MLECAGHDPVTHARQDAGHVLERLARIQPDLFLPQQQAAASELSHRDGKTDARPQRRFLKDHGQRLAGQDRIVLSGLAELFLQPDCDIQDVLKLAAIPHLLIAASAVTGLKLQPEQLLIVNSR